jgi:hypothetical protein
VLILASPSTIAPKLEHAENLTNSKTDENSNDSVRASSPILSKPKEPRDLVLHGCYLWSDDGKWLVFSATDDRGELLETTILPSHDNLKKLFSQIWSFCFQILRSTNIQKPWKIVIGKLGSLSTGELKGIFFPCGKLIFARMAKCHRYSTEIQS